jgi:PKD repeat protein
LFFWPFPFCCWFPAAVPLPNFLQWKNQGCYTHQFNNESEKAERYEWDFGDGNTSDEASPKHRYMSSGNYLVRMKAIDSKNKVEEKKLRIVVDAPELCLIELQTPFGSMLIQLYDSTPKHQDNFVKLAEQQFFDSFALSPCHSGLHDPGR